MASSKKQAERDNEVFKKLSVIRPEANIDYKTELGIAKLYKELFSDHLRFNTTAKKWWVWDGVVWREDYGNSYASDQAGRLFEQLIIYGVKKIESEDIRKVFLDCVRKYGNYSKRKTLLEDASHIPDMIVIQADFDKCINLFNCLDCTLDLDTMESHEHTAGDMLSKVSGCNYNPAANSAKWDKFIDEIMQGDSEKIRYFKKIKGYSITAETFLETGFFLYGKTTRNGKTTAEEVFKAMMGDYAATVQPETLERARFRNGGSAPSPDKARLAGVRFVTIPEPPQGMILDVAFYKQITGGSKVNARFLNADNFEFIPQFKLYFDCNHLPLITDNTFFTSDRSRVIPFERHFEPQEQNKRLKAELQKPEVLSSVLNWALDGLKDLRENGEQPPDCIIKATDDFAKQSDKIIRFVNECLQPSSKNSNGNEVYNVYRTWCKENGYAIDGKQAFNESMREHGYMRSGTVDRRTDRNAIIGYEILSDVQNV